MLSHGLTGGMGTIAVLGVAAFSFLFPCIARLLSFFWWFGCWAASSHFLSAFTLCSSGCLRFSVPRVSSAFVTMSPSPLASLDDWGDLSASLPSPAVAGTVGSSPSVASSGEYDPFVAVGAIAGGGGRLPLWFAGGHSVCLGFVGRGSGKFCTLSVSGASSSCGTMSHSLKKFSVVPGKGYVQLKGAQAKCSPVLDTDQFSSFVLAQIKTAEFEPGEWEKFIPQLNQGVLPGWIKTSALEVEVDDEDSGSKSLIPVSPQIV